MTPAQLDDILADYDRRWGPDRLPGLVSEATAKKLGIVCQAMAEGSAPWAASPADIRATMARAFAQMEEEALKAGHKPLPPACFEDEWAPGRRFAVCWDEQHKHALALRYKAAGEDVSIWSPADIGQLIARLPLCGEIMQTFPGARITTPPAEHRGGKRRFNLGDRLDDILPLPGEDAA